MDMSLLWYVAAAALILVGIAGAIVPAFAGMWLAASVDDYTLIGTGALILLGVLAGIAVLLDFVAGILGARRVAATGRAIWGATIGTFVGIFFGLPGRLLGPFIGALVGEVSAGGTLRRSTEVGVATWIGILFGTVAKIGLSFTMLGVFVAALLLP